MTRYLLAGLVALVLVLGFLLRTAWTSNGELKAEAAALAETNRLLADSRARDEAARLELANKLALEQKRKQVVITKLEQVPVTDDESCVSEVLRQAVEATR